MKKITKIVLPIILLTLIGAAIFFVKIYAYAFFPPGKLCPQSPFLGRKRIVNFSEYVRVYTCEEAWVRNTDVGVRVNGFVPSREDPSRWEEDYELMADGKVFQTLDENNSRYTFYPRAFSHKERWIKFTIDIGMEQNDMQSISN